MIDRSRPDLPLPTVTLEPHGQPVGYFTFASLAALGLPHATTSRHFPGLHPRSETPGAFTADAVAALSSSGVDLARAAWARQVHGADVLRVATPGFAGHGDALVTTVPGVPLAIFTADCLAIVLYDARARVLAGVHAGWRGTVRGAPRAAIEAARDAAARVGDIHAAISPSIGPCCYEVDDPVIDQFSAAYPGHWDRWVRAVRPGHWMLDLWSANEDLLASAGVPREHIDNPRLCTACHPDLLFSYRKANHGRLLTVAALPA